MRPTSRPTRAAAVCVSWRTTAQHLPFDLLIRSGRIVDGTGNPWFVADVGVKGDTIAAVASHLDSGGARIIIDTAGLVVAPGFIDVHSHADGGTSTGIGKNIARLARDTLGLSKRATGR
jgi:adenine deaminase